MKIDFTATAQVGFELKGSVIEYYYSNGELAFSINADVIADFIECNKLNYLGEEEVCINEHPFEKQYKSELQDLFEEVYEYFEKHFEEFTEHYFTQIVKEVRHVA